MSTKRKFLGGATLEVAKKLKLGSTDYILYASSISSCAVETSIDAAPDKVSTTALPPGHRRLARPSPPSNLLRSYRNGPRAAELDADDSEKIARLRAAVRKSVDPVYADQLYLKSKECEKLQKKLSAAEYEISETINAVEEAREKAEADIKKAKAEMEKKFKAELDESRKHSDDLEQRNIELGSQKTKANEETERLKECIENMKAERGAEQDLTKKKLDSVNAENSGLNRRIEDLENANKSLVSQVEQAKEDARTDLAVATTKLADLERDLNAAEVEIRGLEKKNGTLEDAKKRLTKDLGWSETRNTALQDSLNTATSDFFNNFRDITKQAKAAAEKVISLETEISERDEKIEALEATLSAKSGSDISENESNAADEDDEEHTSSASIGGSGGDLESRITYSKDLDAHNPDSEESEIDVDAAEVDDEPLELRTPTGGNDVNPSNDIDSGMDLAGDVISSSDEDFGDDAMRDEMDNEMEDAPEEPTAQEGISEADLDAIIREGTTRARTGRGRGVRNAPTGPRNAGNYQRINAPCAPRDQRISAPRAPRADRERPQRSHRSSIGQAVDHYAEQRRQGLRRTAKEESKMPRRHNNRR